MKKVVLCLLLVFLLAGCHEQPIASTLVTEPPTQAITEPEVTTQPVTQVEETTLPPEPTAPQYSLNVEFDHGTEVAAEGFLIHSYMRDGDSYVLADDLGNVLDGFSWALSEAEESLTLEYDQDVLELAYEPYGEDYDSDNALLFSDENALLIPLSVLRQLPSLCILEDTEESMIYLSKALDHTAIQSGVQVPVLMYHCISDDMYGIKSLYTSPDAFREQMEYLLEQGYEPIFFSDLSHLEDYEKPILITLDDGYEDNYREMYPIIQEYGIRVTVFMITDAIGGTYHLKEDQIREMSRSGLVSIQSHTVEHLILPENDGATQEESMIRSQLILARITGKVPYVLSYPYGEYSATTEELAAKHYAVAVKTGNAMWTSDDGYYHICRLSMYRDTTLSEFAAILEGEMVGSPKA